MQRVSRLTLMIAGMLLFSSVALAAAPSLTWEVGYSDVKSAATDKFIPATVPGAVQLDIARAEKYGPFMYAENWKQYLPMEDRHYTYRTSFPKPDLKAGERLFFVSKGIDYEFEISLNGENLFHQEGMFTWVRLDLTEKLKANNELKVLVYPVPKRYPAPADRNQASNVVKPAVSYGWDFHPRLVPLGIWDDTGLEIQAASHIDDVWVNYDLADDFTTASLSVEAKGRNLAGNRYDWKLLDKDGKPAVSASGAIADSSAAFTAKLANPFLWWPHDHGTPYLYTSVFALKNASGAVVQTVSQKVGFRRVRLVMNEGAWNEPAGFPKSRSNPPAQFEINGRRIFAKGSNWVNPDIFPGTITRDRYKELLDRAVEANLNILRLWGGAIINKESFYDLCDEKGLLIWQEFPLACNNYPDDPHYLGILEQEATSIIQRIKKHPSLALWCGGNELFNGWSGMDDQSYALRLLNSLTYRLCPSVPFNPTSPLSGMAHGNYVFRDITDPDHDLAHQEEVYHEFARSHYTAYTEFGMPAPAPVEVLKKIIPENELWPPKPGTSWESHGAFNAWIGDTQLVPSIINFYFGPPKNLEELVANGQLLQCEGFKAVFEEARRQKPYCAMALNWCFDEPWPAAANNSVLSYPCIPKPGFYAIRDACRPFMASAKISKFKWSEGEPFTTEVWLLNDRFEKMPAGTVIVKLVAGNAAIEIGRWNYSGVPVNANLTGPTTAPFRLPAWDADRFKLVVEVAGKPEFNSEYTLLYQPREGRKHVRDAAPTMNK